MGRDGTRWDAGADAGLRWAPLGSWRRSRLDAVHQLPGPACQIRQCVRVVEASTALWPDQAVTVRERYGRQGRKGPQSPQKPHVVRQFRSFAF